jgi:cysteine desulfurase/selenocysteine lyase
MTNISKDKNHRQLFVGLDIRVPLLDGSHRQYINFDNAASTPPLKAVQKTVNDFMNYYSSVHRGTGFKSQLSTHAYEEARNVLLKFVGADPHTHTCIFGKNTTEAINKLARRYPFSNRRDVVITSGMEHHSNDLPWRKVAKTVHIKIADDGQLNMADFDDQLEQYGQRVALVAITGASNVTGNLNPYHRLAEKAHAVGAHIVVDCAQLAPHRKIDMRSLDDPSHLDYVTLSAHKMYAPLGAGALIGRRDTFERGDPDMSGGGTVEIVTLEDVVWAEPPDRDEAGSPNTVGAIAMAAAVKQLEFVGMDQVADHEATLTAYALECFQSIPEMRIFGDDQPSRARSRLGVIPFQLEKVSHFLVAAILGHEFGIGVRSGCFCAHPFILRLLNITPEESIRVRARMLAGDRSDMPGLIRASFGLYNTMDEVDALVDALKHITRRDYNGEYKQELESGEFIPKGWTPNFENYFSF